MKASMSRVAWGWLEVKAILRPLWMVCDELLVLSWPFFVEIIVIMLYLER